MAPDVGRLWPNMLDPPRSQIIEWAPYLLQLTIADMCRNQCRVAGLWIDVYVH
jgi:hypothetical protein